MRRVLSWWWCFQRKNRLPAELKKEEGEVCCAALGFHGETEVSGGWKRRSERSPEVEMEGRCVEISGGCWWWLRSGNGEWRVLRWAAKGGVWFVKEGWCGVGGGVFFFLQREDILKWVTIWEKEKVLFLSLFWFSFFISRERREAREGCEVTWKGEWISLREETC